MSIAFYLAFRDMVLLYTINLFYDFLLKFRVHSVWVVFNVTKIVVEWYPFKSIVVPLRISYTTIKDVIEYKNHNSTEQYFPCKHYIN